MSNFQKNIIRFWVAERISFEGFSKPSQAYNASVNQESKGASAKWPVYVSVNPDPIKGNKLCYAQHNGKLRLFHGSIVKIASINKSVGAPTARPHGAPARDWLR